MLMCSPLLNNFQESLSCHRYETWSWTEFLSPGKHAKPAQTRKTCSVQTVHSYLHEQEQPWPRVEQVSPFFSVHIFSCTCVLPEVWAGLHMLLGTKQELILSPELVSPQTGTGIPHSFVTPLISARKYASNCHLLCACLQCYWHCGNYSWYQKVSFTCIQVWGWACSGALKYQSAAELGFRTPIYNTKRTAVERAQSQINTFERAVQCHADLPTYPEEDHIFKRPYLLFLKTLYRSGVPRILHSYSLLRNLITPLQMHL